MKKLLNQPTNYLVLEGVIFVTMYLTLGNGISNMIIQKDLQYLLFSVFAWITQFFGVTLLMLLFYWILKVILLLLSKRKRIGE